jgi:DNA-binding CsgD family transcriptional regulator
MSANLTPKEIQVLKLMGQSYTTKQTADLLGNSVYTIRAHQRNISLKLNANNRTHAVMIGIEKEFLKLPVQNFS